MNTRHIRFLLRHGLAGVLVGLGAAAAIVALNVAQLRTLLLGVPDGWIGIALLGFGFAVTFGSAAMGAAIMGLREDEGHPRPPPGRLVPAMIALPTRAPARRR